MIILSNEIANEGMGKISAQPHTIVKQICFPNGNVLFLSLFSLSKTECIMLYGAVRKFYHECFERLYKCQLVGYFCDVFYFSSDQERICQRKICWTQVTVFLPNKWLESCWNDYKKVSLSVLIFVLSFTWVFHNNLIGGAKDNEPCFASLRN